MKRKGFTVVELVIVIAVIGILAGILIPSFIYLLNSANETSTQANLTIAYKEYAVDAFEDGILDKGGENIVVEDVYEEYEVNIYRDGQDYEYFVQDTWREARYFSDELLGYYNGCFVYGRSIAKVENPDQTHLYSAFEVFKFDMHDGWLGNWGSVKRIEPEGQDAFVAVWDGEKYIFQDGFWVPASVELGFYIYKYDDVEFYYKDSVEEAKEINDLANEVYDLYEASVADPLVKQGVVFVTSSTTYVLNQHDEWYALQYGYSWTERIFTTSVNGKTCYLYPLKNPVESQEWQDKFNTAWDELMIDFSDGYIGTNINMPVDPNISKEDVTFRYKFEGSSVVYIAAYTEERGVWHSSSLSVNIDQIGTYNDLPAYFMLYYKYNDKKINLAESLYAEYYEEAVTNGLEYYGRRELIFVHFDDFIDYTFYYEYNLNNEWEISINEYQNLDVYFASTYSTNSYLSLKF